MVIAPARRAGDPGSNPGSGENFSLKLLIYILFPSHLNNDTTKEECVPTSIALVIRRHCSISIYFHVSS